MASIMDAGMGNDIHPKNKQPVGERLALLALGKVYGEKILCEAPELSRINICEGGLDLLFNNAGDGLYLNGDRLNAFHLIMDGKEAQDYSFVLREGRIDIQHKDITQTPEIKVLFAYEPYCEVNLYNSSGIPAKPFRWSNKSKKEEG